MSHSCRRSTVGRKNNENRAGRVKWSKNADTEAIGRNTDSFQTKECLGYFGPQ